MRCYLSHVPLELGPTAYGEVRAKMVDAFAPEKPSGLAELPISPDPLEYIPPDLENVDLSFARQMKDIYDQPESTEVFLVTANSAIPVADSVRGFFDELGIDSPGIQYVRADRKAATHYYVDQTREDLVREADRLRQLLEGIKRVCVLDQYVATGSSIGFASEILLKGVGAERVQAIRGQWYNNALPGQLDFANVSSVHKKEMHGIGVDACQVAFA